MAGEYDGFEIFVTESKTLPTEEWVKATLSKITQRDGKYGPMYAFTFKAIGKEYEGQVVWANVGASVSNNPNSKSYKWYNGLLGRELNSGEKIKLGACVGKVFEIFIESKVSGNKTFQNVTKVRTLKTGDSEDVEAEVTDISEEPVEERPVKRAVLKKVKQEESVEEEEDVVDNVSEEDDLDISDLDLDEDIPL